MSSKGTIILTEDNEHWYDETFEKDGDDFRVYIEIREENIKYFEKNENGISIGIKGNSELAGIIKLLKYRFYSEVEEFQNEHKNNKQKELINY